MKTIRKRLSDILIGLLCLVLVAGLSFSSLAGVTQVSAANEATVGSGNLIITPESPGPYLAGSTVKFKITVTNNSDSDWKENEWGFRVTSDNSAIEGFSAVQTTELKKTNTGEYEMEFTIPEDFDSSEEITLTIAPDKYDKGGSKWKNEYYFYKVNNVKYQIKQEWSFTVKSLEGVRVKSGEDDGSDLGNRDFTLKYTLKNYGETAATFDYSMEVKDSEGNVIDPSNYDVTWSNVPDSVDSKAIVNDVEAHVVFHDDVKDKYSVPFEFTMNVVDDATKAESSATVKIEGASAADFLPSGILAKGGLDLLYYGNVKEDKDAPFHSRDELEKLLANSSKAYAQKIWDRYKYDLYDPNCFVGDPTCTKTSGKSVSYGYGAEGVKYANFWDDQLSYSKDGGNSPFHTSINQKINPLGYNLEDRGIDFGDYFKNLEKTAGPNLGDRNSERQYMIELAAETNPTVKTPQLYVFQIQTSWQMFDMLHANATKTYHPGVDSPEGMSVGSCSFNTSMADLYDVKKALLRFADFLEEYDDGSSMIAITNVQHGGTNSMISNGYFTNDMDDLKKGIIGWDTFGDCEHVHYSSDALDNAIGQVSTILSQWTDKDGNPLAGQAKTSAIIIGGPTENSTGDSGYGIDLTKTDVVAVDKNTKKPLLDHVYGIRVNDGTNVDGEKNSKGDDIISWLDIDENQTLFAKSGNGFYAASTEDKVYDALIDIYNKNNSDEEIMESTAVVEDVTIEDTVTPEFEVVGVKAYYETTDSDGKAVKTELPESDYEVKTILNDDGSTDVKVIYKKVVGKKKLVVDIDTDAKTDYLGSNNVYTNVGKAGITSYTRPAHKNSTGTTTVPAKVYSDEIEFPETPQVNVPISLPMENGLTIMTEIDEDVDLKDLAFEQENTGTKITANFERMLNRYKQISGRVTYQWVDSNGNLVGEATTSDIVNGAGNPPEIPSFIYTTKDGDLGSTVTYALKISFEPLDVEEGNPNDVAVSEGESDTNETGQVNIIVAKKVGITFKKVDGKSEKGLADVHFDLYHFKNDKDEGTLIDTDLVTDKNGYLPLTDLKTGDYELVETTPADGYIKPDNPVRFSIRGKNIILVKNFDGNDAAFNSAEAVYIITNQSKYTLPSAGGPGTYIFTFFGVAVLATGILLLMMNRRKPGEE